MSEDNTETLVPLRQFNTEGHKPYEAPYRMYEVLYPKLGGEPGVDEGYTVDKYWRDVCWHFGWGIRSIELPSLEKLSDCQDFIVDDAKREYRKPPYQKSNGAPGEKETALWWISRTGDIDNLETSRSTRSHNKTRITMGCKSGSL
ncbi:hypothetical protein N0V83_010991 [Neocucurbitaria cava]|uniref:Uncharacterized protein n=1 Tax=Neocucurbitaria cava TaxID=798079 RepID=A0A9W8Y0E9_9PLEO|nr:hypothetical protein N0V83_010991 [Neocucurbitaria cava]